MALRKIHLYGKLGKLFGKKWELDVNTVGEAIRAIDINTNNKFSEYLSKGKGAKTHYKVSVKKRDNLITKEEINSGFGKGDIYIAPTIKGYGKNGVLQTIVGVVLIAVGAYFGTDTLVKVGIAMALGGVAQMLAPNPNAESSEARNSYLFQGNATTVYQGGAVGIVYGRALTVPMPVCISVNNGEESSYIGDKIITGPTGPMTDLLYSYMDISTSIVGYREYDGYASNPIKRYLKMTASGVEQYFFGAGCSTLQQRNVYSGTSTVSTVFPNEGDCLTSAIKTMTYPSTLVTELSAIGLNVDLPRLYGDMGGTQWVTVKSATSCRRDYDGVCRSDMYGEAWASVSGAERYDLSDEDTEEKAIQRNLDRGTWSAWSSIGVASSRTQRTGESSSFSCRYVRIKTATSEKFNPAYTYKYTYTKQTTLIDSSDPYQDAGIVTNTVKPDSNGDIQIETSTESGYLSRVINLKIELAKLS